MVFFLFFVNFYFIYIQNYVIKIKLKNKVWLGDPDLLASLTCRLGLNRGHFFNGPSRAQTLLISIYKNVW